jgi:hypothetical protein
VEKKWKTVGRERRRSNISGKEMENCWKGEEEK